MDIPLAAIVRQVRRCRLAGETDQDAVDVLTIISAFWEATGEGAYVVGAPHNDPRDCPTYYDKCNCTVEMISGLLEDKKRT